MLTWLTGNLNIIPAALIVGTLGFFAGHWQGARDGENACIARQVEQTRGKLNDAINADDIHRSHLNDPDYRLQDDGFKRRSD